MPLSYQEKREEAIDHFDMNMTDDEFFELDFSEQDRIRDNYLRSEIGEPPPGTVQEPIEEETEDPGGVGFAAEEGVKGFVRGSLGIPESAGTAMQYAGERMKDPIRETSFKNLNPTQKDRALSKASEYIQGGMSNQDALDKATEETLAAESERPQPFAEKLIETGKVTEKHYSDLIKDYEKDKSLEGNVFDDPGLILKPAFWTSGIAEMIPSLAATIIPAAGTEAAMVKIGGKLLPLTKAGIANLARLSKYVGAGVGGGTGAGLEATSTYKTVLEKTGDEKQAARSAEAMFAAATVLNSVGNLNMLEGLGKNIFSKFGYGYVIEGVTEGAEEPAEVGAKIFGAFMEGKPLPEDISGMLLQSVKEGVTVALPAGVGGGVVSAGSRDSEAQKGKSKAKDILLEEDEKGKTATEMLTEEDLVEEEIPEPDTADYRSRKAAQETMEEEYARGDEPLPTPPVIPEQEEFISDVEQAERDAAYKEEQLGKPTYQAPVDIRRQEIEAGEIQARKVGAEVPAVVEEKPKPEFETKQLEKALAEPVTEKKEKPKQLPPGQGFELIDYEKPATAKIKKQHDQISSDMNINDFRRANSAELTQQKAQYKFQKNPALEKVIDEELTSRAITQKEISKAKKARKAEKKPTGATTLGGWLKETGSINPANQKSDLLSRDKAGANVFKKDGREIEKAQAEAIKEGWLLPSENLTDIITNEPERLRSGKLEEAAKTKYQKEQAAKLEEEAPAELPPDYDVEGAYKQILAGDLKEGTEAGMVIDGKYDTYKVIKSEPFEMVKLKDGKTISVEPGKTIEVREKGKKERLDEVSEEPVSYEHEVKSHTIKEPHEQLELAFKPAKALKKEQYPAIPEKIPHYQRAVAVTTGHIDSPGTVLSNTSEVASLLSPIRKSAQELAYTVAVDKKGNVLEVHKYSKGGKGSATIIPSEVAGRALNIKGVDRIYFAHNHPSQDVSFSPEDTSINKKLSNILGLKDIKFEPLVISGTKWGGYAESGLTASEKIKPTLKKKKIPVKERMLRIGKAYHKNKPTSNAAEVISFMKENLDNAEGFLFLNAKNLPVGFLPYPKGKSMKAAAAEIYAAQESMNATSMVFNSHKQLAHKNRTDFIEAFQEEKTGPTLLDIIIDGKSLASAGTMPKGTGQWGLLGLGEEELYSVGRKPISSGISLPEIKSIFPGQKVGLSNDGSIWVQTTGGNGLSIKNVSQTTPDNYSLHMGYGKLKDGELIAGKYKTGTIEVSSIGDKWTLAHESFHWIEDIGLLSEKEQKILDNMTGTKSNEARFKELSKIGKDSFTKQQSKEYEMLVRGKEARARFIEQSLKNRDKYRGTAFGKILQKISDFIDSLANFIISTPGGIIREIESGRIYGRTAEALAESSGLNSVTAARWYSQMGTVIEEKLPGKGSPEQFKKTLQSWAKKGIIKQEELQWSGVENWLDGQEGKVTKDQVLDYLKENNVRIEEVVKQQNAKATQEQIDRYGELAEKGRANLTMPELEEYDYLYHLTGSLGQDTTKFAEYQLPGGKKYKELMLVLPGKDIGFKISKGHRYGDIADINRIAHVRFSERDVDRKRVLHIEEIQSDIHQLGRKKGYKEKITKLPEGWTIIQKWPGKYNYAPDGMWVIEDAEGKEIAKGKEKKKTINTALTRATEKQNGGKVPDVPFKKTWPMLTMKRMIRHASENGFDSIAWTPGELQAERYDMSKDIDRVEYWKPKRPYLKEKRYGVTVYDKSNKNIYSTGIATVQELEDNIGKELTQKVIDTAKPTKKTLKGLDLKVGGEGLISFYDKMLVNEVNSFFGKKTWGNPKIETIKVGKNDLWSIQITPEMKDKSLYEGMPLYSAGKATDDMVSEEENVVQDNGLKILNYAKQRFGKRYKNEKDLLLIEDMLDVPRTIGKRHPVIGRLVDITTRGSEQRSKMVYDYYNKGVADSQAKISKNKQRYQELTDLIWAVEGNRFKKADVPTDWYQKPEKGEPFKANEKHYEEVRAFLEKKKYHPDVVDAFIDIRKTLDQTRMDLGNLMMNTKDFDPNLIQEYRSSVGKIHNYFPHAREGNSFVQVIDSSGNVAYREHYFTFPDRLKSENNKADARAKQWADKEGLKGYKIKQGKVKQMPDEMFENIPIEAMQQLVTESAKKVAASSEGLSKEETADFKNRMEKAISLATAEVFKSRGFGQHAIKRKGTPGYIKDDPYRSLFDYINGFSGFKTKMERSKEYSTELFGIEAKKTPGVYRYASSYIKDMLANQDAVDRGVDRVRALFFMKYLGFVVKSGMVNLTQNVVMAVPMLSKHTTGMLKAEKLMAKAMLDTRKALASKEAVIGKEITYKNLTPEELKAVQELHQKGVTIDQYLRELKGRLPGRGWATLWNKALENAGFFMRIAERFNRESTGLAGFRLAYYEGVKGNPETKGNYDASVKFASDLVYDSHFLYGKANLPSAVRGGTVQKYAKSMYTFRQFSHNYGSILFNEILQSPVKGSFVLVKSLMGLSLVGGLSAWPFFEMISSLFFDDDEDPMTEIRAKISSKRLKDVATYGLPGAAGFDITGSLSMSLPENFYDILGVPYAAVEDLNNMMMSIKAGDYYRAVAETPITPMVIRNAMRGHELYQTGQKTRSGRMITEPGTTKPRKLGTVEAVGKGVFGLQPTGMSKGYAAYRATRKATEAMSEKKRNLANRYVNAVRRDDEKERKKILLEVKNWNEKAKKENKPYRVINIQGMLKSRLRGRGSMVPRQMRRREGEIVKEWTR